MINKKKQFNKLSTILLERSHRFVRNLSKYFLDFFISPKSDFSSEKKVFLVFDAQVN